MSEMGEAIVRGHYNPDGSIQDVEMVRADDLIAVSPELLKDHDERWMRVDGDRLVLCGEAFYVATGKDDGWGNPTYRRVRNEGDL